MELADFELLAALVLVIKPGGGGGMSFLSCDAEVPRAASFFAPKVEVALELDCNGVCVEGDGVFDLSLGAKKLRVGCSYLSAEH